jgi:hypothetical protein
MALHARRRSAAASGATRTIAVALALWAMLAVAAALLAGPATAQQNPPTRAITEIAPNLYRFQNNFHFSVFLVTDDGVLATDPINADAATWLEG